MPAVKRNHGGWNPFVLWESSPYSESCSGPAFASVRPSNLIYDRIVDTVDTCSASRMILRHCWLSFEFLTNQTANPLSHQPTNQPINPLVPLFHCISIWRTRGTMLNKVILRILWLLMEFCLFLSPLNGPKTSSEAKINHHCVVRWFL